MPKPRYRQYLSVRGQANEYLTENNLPDSSNLYNVVGDTIFLIEAGRNLATQLNKALFDGSKDTLGFTKFTNPAQSYYISTKVNIGDLGLGFVSLSKEEGIGTTFTDFTASASGSRWKPAHHYIYLNYNKRLNNKLLFTTFLNYRIHTIKNGSKITSVRSYTRWGGLELKDLYREVPSSWLTTYYYEQSEQFRSEFRLLYNQSKYFYLISGIELRNGQLQGYYLTDITSSVPEDHGTYPDSLPGGNHYNVNDIGIYTQGSYRSKNGFGFTLGARLDYNQIRHGGGLGYNLSPRFVIDYTKKEWVFKAIISKGIQNVSNYTKFDNVLVTPNDSLKAEKIYNYEISAGYKISNTFMADVDFFFSNVKDVISLYQENHVIKNTNNGKYKIKGIQTNLYFNSIDKKWQASLNYTYTDSKRTRGVGTPPLGEDNINSEIVTSTVKVADIAPHKVNAVVNFSFLKNLNINFRGNYVSSKKSGPGTTVPFNRVTEFDGYFLGNIAIGVQNLVKGTTIQFICNNIFDKEYYSPGIRYGGGIRYPNSILQMGRNFLFKINYEF
jgi:outer membrane receptor for ferrienterochelin and colicins